MEKQCSICHMPMREEDDMLLCPNGHAVQILKEVQEYNEGFKKTVRKPERTKYQIDLLKYTDEEICKWISMDYFYFMVREFSIPLSFCQRYMPLVYSVFSYLERSIKPRYSEGTQLGSFCRHVLYVVFLIKREHEEKQERFYMLFDFKRKLLFNNKTAKFLKQRVEKAEKATYRLMGKHWASVNMSILYIPEFFRIYFPENTSLHRGVFGLMNQVSLESVCELLGISITERLLHGFNVFLEDIDLLKLNRSSLIPSETLLGAYLYIYYVQMCYLEVINGRILIVEKITDISKKKVVQDFFCREISFSSLKQFVKYLMELEKTNGLERPILNPLEFPAESFGGVITPHIKSIISQKILYRISFVVHMNTSSLATLIKKIYNRYSHLKARL
ncbi:hypothetical protein NEFER03_1725 [Nematocida sp. LUAm3]|nr:hypothetical protein NEFER03_1725 [Nematocida sp. LUAm3]KAI5175715.1 hypothetical protein NEFER02_1602 [Nematocida sp. LUAm2]KAI5178621.1 hypothetical protein NEFER01_1757 [Nematocida sp. LUAm1]